jgi:D-alanine-D-alanine ligase
MRIGIFFGGVSREREISFAGGRTVYDNLDKSLFTPVPIFMDSLGNLILLDWQYLYKGTVRDFYPPVDFLHPSPNNFQVYIESLSTLHDEQLEALIEQVGIPIIAEQLPDLIDFAFLALHGNVGEDGQLQGLLEYLKLPYSGSGIRASSIGMDKSYQKKLMEAGGFLMPNMEVFHRRKWLKNTDKASIAQKLVEQIGLPMVVRPANQGSSIGVSIIHTIEDVIPSIDAAFFIENITPENWASKRPHEQIDYLRDLTDIRTGIGFPCQVIPTKEVFYHPEDLLVFITNFFEQNKREALQLHGYNAEHTVVVESFISGREFSCVVIKGEEGETIALPPTEILKGKEVFDYRSKYLAGLSRKLTPIDLPTAGIEAIRQECNRLFEYLEFNTYARIDGFVQEDGSIFLNDPNTTSGMLPSSFFFHQAAEIGLNPSQFLTYIIRTSLVERIETTTIIGLYEDLLSELDESLATQKTAITEKKKIAVFLGGYSSERHISVESGRNIYEKLASSDEYTPIPIFVTGNLQEHALYHIPINLLLKDNADDISDKLENYTVHPILTQIQEECHALSQKYTKEPPIFSPKAISYQALAEMVDGVFIALHGRPGEDGQVQKILQEYQIPYNGSVSTSAQVTINKYDTLQRLKQKGLSVTEQLLVDKAVFISNPSQAIENVEKVLDYPLIAKPVDDGCSSAVKKIKNSQELEAFLIALFRVTETVDPIQEGILGLKPKEEFPQKEVALLEALIDQKTAAHFLEITGGLLTRYNDAGEIEYEIFEPSEALASGEILSLEEKFLAGEGQNITPARFVPQGSEWTHEQISSQVRATLKQAAEILGVTGYARIDAFVRIYPDGTAETIVIEVNSLPGMTPATCIFHQCAINGYKPYHFIQNILDFGFERNQRLIHSTN